MRIAIQADSVQHKNGELQSFSDRWKELAQARGIEVRDVDVESPEFFGKLRKCDGFMWRFGYDPHSLGFAKRLLPAVEHGLGIPVFPAWESCWSFEDKIAQHYLMQAAGIPTPRTTVLWSGPDALEFCRNARYPLVAKLARGFQSSNVRLLHDFHEAKDLIRQIFGAGLVSLQEQPSLLKRTLRHRLQAARLLAGKPLPPGIQQGYLYVQEFLPGNAFDTRVTVIGNRAFAFRRFNRPEDFRASGSGRIDWSPSGIDLPTVRLAFDIARKLNTQSLAIDGLRRGEERVICELSYTYAAWAIRECPGHWELKPEPENCDMTWVDGTLRAEDAIFDDFVTMVGRRREARCAQPLALP